jgi:acyl-CoA synthetase (AMP-forming)/AMP-acid ligase II
MTEATRLEWPSIPALLAAAEERHAERVAVLDGATQLTYPELATEARRFAAALVESGVEQGDRVAIWCFNCAEWVVAVLGIFAAGAVLVPVNTRFKGREAAEILRRSSARTLVTVTDFLGTDYLALLEGAGIPLPALESVVLARGRRDEADHSAVDWKTYLGRATPVALEEVRCRSAMLGPEDPSDILFTSGTTGVPKGVVMTHGRTLTVASDWVAMSGLQEGDVYLQVNPYFHMFGLKAGILASIVAGATMLPEAVFDVDGVLSRVEAERVTVLPGAPTIYQAILDHPDRQKHDLSSLRVAVTGAADIPVKLIHRVQQELPFRTIITGYGLTEGGTACATSEDDDPEPSRPPSAGLVRASSCASSARVTATSPPARPARCCCAGAASWRGTSTILRRPHTCCRRTAGCAPVTSECSTTQAACASSAASRTCSSWAGSTPTRPRSRMRCCAIRRSGRPR